MKPGLITMFLLVLTGIAAGCGQKGSLYRDAPSKSNAETEAVSANRATPDEER